MPGPFYFAWVDGPIAFDENSHAVEDEAIIALKVAQEEGDFASLEITIKNPGHGLLAEDQPQWCWLSWDDGSSIVPLFHGRVIAVPQKTDGEAVDLLFRAKVDDFEDLKKDIAAFLRVLPYHDPVWISGDTEDDDSVLDAYGARWHIDRTTLVLAYSDELEGEDAPLIFDDGTLLYDGFDINYADRPATTVKVKATLTWSQTGEGTIDMTEELYHLFRAKKSIYIAPHSGVISTLTGQGLLDDWPKGGTSFGGGWTVNVDTKIIEAPEKIYKKYNYEMTYQGLPSNYNPDTLVSTAFFVSDIDWTAKFPIYGLQQVTKFDWKADKKRTEILEFSLKADMQPLTEAPSDQGDTVDITISASDTVTEPDGLGDMPIVDKKRKSYLNTTRGYSSVEHLVLLARAQLRSRARAVEITFRVPWADGISATLRKSATISDSRIPGGTATGKIISYEMAASGTGENYVEMTIGCSVGRGGTVTASEGIGTYANEGYMNAGYQSLTGLQNLSITGDVVWQALTDFTADDDGVDLLTLDETTAVDSLILYGGLSDQIDAITAAGDPVAELKLYPSRVCLQLKPVADVSFSTTYSPTTLPMPMPKLIDLESA